MKEMKSAKEGEGVKRVEGGEIERGTDSKGKEMDEK